MGCINMEIGREMENKVEGVRDAGEEIFREMIMKYGIFDIETARLILGTKIRGKLSETVIELREEE